MSGLSMSTPPPDLKIFHITHVDNLPAIIASGGLLSDASMIALGGPQAGIGMSRIKQRRLKLPVPCHTGSHVGDYVPFYFCPRSIMLYVIHRANDPDLAYRGGQGPIVHLQADLHAVVSWANQNERSWAFTLSNAGARYTSFRTLLDDLGQIDWNAVESTNFQTATVKDAKQAEFLVHGELPWKLVEFIGVNSQEVRRQTLDTVATSDHRPPIELRSKWYY